MKRILKKDGVNILIAQAVSSGATLIGNILMARQLGEEQLGEIAPYWWLLLLPNGIGQAIWIQQGPRINHHLLPKGVNIFKEHFTTALILNLIITSLTVSVAYMLGFISKYIIEGGIYIFCWSCYDFTRRWVILDGKPKTGLVIDLIYACSILLVSIFIIYPIKRIDVTLISWAVASVIPILFVPKIWWAISSFKKIKEVLAYLFSEGKWLIGTSLVQWYAGNAFLAVGSKILLPNDVGALRASQTLMGGWNVIFQFLESGEPKKYTDILVKNGKKGLSKFVAWRISISIGLAVVFMGIQAMIASPLLTIIYGKDFAKHAWVLQAFCVLYVFVAIGYPIRFASRALGKNSSSFWGYCGAALIGLFSAPLIIENYGLAGILIGLFLTQIIQIITIGGSLILNLKTTDQ